MLELCEIIIMTSCCTPRTLLEK